MGKHANITHDKFPMQGEWVGKRVKVCFHYDTDNFLLGTVVRNDTEAPLVDIIKLDDGRFVLTTECMFAPAE